MQLSAIVSEEPLVLTGPNDSIVFEGVIRGFTGEERDKYFENQRLNVVAGAGASAGLGGVKSAIDIFAKTIVLSVVDNVTGKKVTLDVVRKWPGAVQEAVANKILELSGLTEASQEEAKNA